MKGLYKEFKERLKKVKKTQKRKSVVIFEYPGEYKGKYIHLVQVNSTNYICDSKDGVNNLINAVKEKYDIITIIIDEWQEERIEEILKGEEVIIWRG